MCRGFKEKRADVASESGWQQLSKLHSTAADKRAGRQAGRQAGSTQVQHTPPSHSCGRCKASAAAAVAAAAAAALPSIADAAALGASPASCSSSDCLARRSACAPRATPPISKATPPAHSVPRFTDTGSPSRRGVACCCRVRCCRDPNSGVGSGCSAALLALAPPPPLARRAPPPAPRAAAPSTASACHLDTIWPSRDSA